MDYYPGGMLQPGRTFNTTSAYRYGFNGKEQDSIMGGGRGIDYNYGARIYDAMAVRFLSLDPLQKKYPELTPYQFGSNRLIDGIDLDGREWIPTKTTDPQTGIATISYDIELKVVNGNLTNDQLDDGFKDAQTRFETALNNTSDGKTIYKVTIHHTIINAGDAAKEAATGLVMIVKDYRQINTEEYNRKNLLSVGLDGAKSTQYGSFEVSAYDATINTKGELTFAFSAGSFGAATDHELGHGARLAHPEDETIKDIAQYVMKNGRPVVLPNGEKARSAVPDEIILSNIMNTGANKLLTPVETSDLKTLTKGQVDQLVRAVDYDYAQSKLKNNTPPSNNTPPNPK